MASRRIFLYLPLGCALFAAGCERSKQDEPNATVRFMDSDAIDISNGHGLYRANRAGKVTAITFPVPLDRVDPDRLHIGERLGQTNEGVVVMIDHYASRSASGPCAQGEEAFVRAFSLPEKREVFATVAGGCLAGIKPGDPIATWLGKGRFQIGGVKPRTYTIERSTVHEARRE